MGFCYGINPITGKESLACDFCDMIAGEPGITRVRKVRCPYGYCQDWATCNLCKAAGKHKRASCGFETDELNANHQGCKLAQSREVPA